MRPFTKNIHKCLTCGLEFALKPSATKFGQGKYCSQSCKAKDYTRERNHAWKGGRNLAGGYWKLTLPGLGTVYEHRHLMEQMLGRKLRPRELVYHINGISHDNTPSNLSLTPPKRKFFRTELPDGDTRPLEPVEP